MVVQLHHRSHRLLLADTNGTKSRSTFTNEASFDTNMVIILAALLCALICALGLNAIVRCAFRCSRRFVLETSDETAVRLAVTGLRKSALRQIPVAAYSSGMNLKVTDCPICLAEFMDGEKIRVLPKCNHGFHVKCIDTWLLSHSSCPSCRQSLLEPATCSDDAPAMETGTRQHGNSSGGQADAPVAEDETLDIYPTEETVYPNDDNIISSLLALRDENENPLLEDEIIDVFLSLIVASHDTTANLLTLFVRLLSRDAEVSNKVFQGIKIGSEQNEVVKTMERNGGKLTWNEIHMMRYRWRAGQELIRVNPPMLGSFRLVTKDISFGGYDIPKGWQVFWVAPGTHIDSNIFDYPEKFDPSRFESSSKAFPPYTYVPSGAGHQICAGIEFARLEALLIIHPVTKYSWTEMIPDEPIIREPMPYPAMGLPFNLYPRT